MLWRVFVPGLCAVLRPVEDAVSPHQGPTRAKIPHWRSAESALVLQFSRSASVGHYRAVAIVRNSSTCPIARRIRPYNRLRCLILITYEPPMSGVEAFSNQFPKALTLLIAVRLAGHGGLITRPHLPLTGFGDDLEPWMKVDLL